MHTLAKTFAAELEGIEARTIEIEVDLHVGLHSFNIVGLADKALTEARERVSSALKNSGMKPPNRENRKITVNLAPADIKKTGSHYDLPIALGYLLATSQIKAFDTTDKMFVGELALNGALRPIQGALNIAEWAKTAGFKELYLPEENAEEAALIPGIHIIPLKNFEEVVNILEGRAEQRPVPQSMSNDELFDTIDLSEIKGQEHAKRALIITAAGGHNLLMVGSPGAGKSMLAKAMTGILPRLAENEAIEITKIWSAAGLRRGGLMHIRPFRAPHHNASTVAVIGGGNIPKPGEISLAHRGVLFLDELPEFRRDLLEALRQPLEEGSVHIARARGSLMLPARFTLLAAMNPCPCGYFGDPEKECRCTGNEVFRYQKKISGPLLDRIDLQITVPRVEVAELRKQTKSETSESDQARKRIAQAREIQKKRFIKAKRSIHTNAEMSSKDVEEYVLLEPEAEKFLEDAMQRSFLSARGYYRILKTARTIADLENSENVKREHVSEAFGYRVRQKE